MVTEFWKDVPDYEGYYQASDWGRVQSVDRMVVTRGGYRCCKGKILHPTPAKGYLSVMLSKENKTTRRRVHVLVLETFVGVRPSVTQTRHLDSDGYNNMLTNLCWGTPLENSADKITRGTHLQLTLRKAIRRSDGKVFSDALSLSKELCVSRAAVCQAVIKGFSCQGYTLEYM